jgi:hypothetical protein
MPRKPTPSNPPPLAPWCKRIFAADAEEVWSWYSGLRSSSLPRRSVNDLWHRPSRNTRKRQLFDDNEMRRRILGIKKGEYIALTKPLVKSIVARWAAERREKQRKSAPVELVEVDGELVEGDGELVDSGEPAATAPTDSAAVALRLAAAVAAKEMHSRVSARLNQLHSALEDCRVKGVLKYETEGAFGACILGWSRMIVDDPLALNHAVRDVVRKDLVDGAGVWCTNEPSPTARTDLTWEAYSLLRRIGCKPRVRGPESTDPGVHDLLYYGIWTYNEDAAFNAARLSLAKHATRVAAGDRKAGDGQAGDGQAGDGQ